MRTTWPAMEARAEPICTMGPSRPTEPPTPMHTAEARALTTVTWGRMRPPSSATAIITSGTPWPRASRANALDERPVDQPAHHRDHQHEPDAQPGQMQAAHPALLAELLMAGGQPGETEDQPPKPRRPQARRPRRPARP